MVYMFEKIFIVIDISFCKKVTQFYVIILFKIIC